MYVNDHCKILYMTATFIAFNVTGHYNKYPSHYNIHPYAVKKMIL